MRYINLRAGARVFAIQAVIPNAHTLEIQNYPTKKNYVPDKFVLTRSTTARKIGMQKRKAKNEFSDESMLC